MRLLLLDQLDASILGAPLFRVVRRDRGRAAHALGKKADGGDAVLLSQRSHYRSGAPLG